MDSGWQYHKLWTQAGNTINYGLRLAATSGLWAGTISYLPCTLLYAACHYINHVATTLILAFIIRSSFIHYIGE